MCVQAQTSAHNIRTSEVGQVRLRAAVELAATVASLRNGIGPLVARVVQTLSRGQRVVFLLRFRLQNRIAVMKEKCSTYAYATYAFTNQENGTRRQRDTHNKNTA